MFLQFIDDVTRVSSDWTGGFSWEGAGKAAKVMLSGTNRTASVKYKNGILKR